MTELQRRRLPRIIGFGIQLLFALAACQTSGPNSEVVLSTGITKATVGVTSRTLPLPTDHTDMVIDAFSIGQGLCVSVDCPAEAAASDRNNRRFDCGSVKRTDAISKRAPKQAAQAMDGSRDDTILFISDRDADHYNVIRGIVEEFRTPRTPGRAFCGGEDRHDFKAACTTWLTNGVGRGDRYPFGHPTPATELSEDSTKTGETSGSAPWDVVTNAAISKKGSQLLGTNKVSIVLQFGYGGYALLLTGDGIEETCCLLKNST